MKLFPEYKSYLILDMYNLIFRNMKTGLSVTEGVMSLINTILKKVGNNWDGIYCCFDSPPYKRNSICTSYKCNRGLAINHPIINQETEELIGFLINKGYACFKQEGYEADDLIAQICYDKREYNLVVVSPDEDLFQLLHNPNISLLRYVGGEYHYFNKNDFIYCYGIAPQQWVMVKAIAGCRSDGVIGLKGVGETKAINYLLGIEPELVSYKLNENRELVDTNLSLVTLPLNRLMITYPEDND